jgi:hypothetical protein
MVRAFLAVFMATVFFVSSSHAMEIQQFDRMAGDDQMDYVDKLAQSVEDATQGDAHARAVRFFKPKQPGETISGMGQFEMALSLARIADLDAAVKNPKARRLEVEDVMHTILDRNGIILSKPIPVRFHPTYPPGKAMTRQEADKALEQTKKWVAMSSAEHTKVWQSEAAGRRTLPSNSTGPFSNVGAGIAFFVALVALAAASGSGSGYSGGDSGDVVREWNSKPWWEKQGFNTYHDAARSICLTAHNGNSTWC